MNFSRIDTPFVGALPNNQTDFAARQTALQFEALFLKQLTAALNPPQEEGEDSLFSSTGADMYKQMFSDHIAQVMADNGGIGLADTILRQLQEKAEAKNAALERAIDTAKSLQEEKPAAAVASEVLQAEVSEVSAAPMPLHAPLEGRITSGFGLRNDPINGHLRQHHGIDIAAPRGTAIGAAAAGTVVFAGRRGGYGNTVIIEQADGKQTLYGHADQLMVRVGDEVAAGQQIATVGSTGRSTGPHLHFEVRENGQSVNPVTTYAKDFVLPDR
ncbi:MAG: peptidoglycan DD-metalloendopeptidase family protein [Blastocatellia bacterium]